MGFYEVEYKGKFLPGLEAAISDALSNEVAAALIYEAEQSATENVYDAYSPVEPTPRRYSFEKDYAYYTETNGTEITLTATAHLQNLWYSNSNYEDPSDLAEIVALGIRNYNMPFARPWLDKAVENGLADGMIEMALETGLKRQGF